MLKPLSTLEKMHPKDSNVFASNIIDKYENQPVDLHSLCLADFASNCVSKKSGSVPVDENKSYTIPVSNIDDIEPNPNIIVLKNKHSEMWKRNSVICFHKFSNLKIQKMITYDSYIYALKEWGWIKTRQ